MAKLDEIAELLTEEIKGFENSADRMEQRKKFLIDYKVQDDTSDIDFGQGEEKAVVHFRAFFRANPEAAEIYQNWTEHQSKK